MKKATGKKKGAQPKNKNALKHGFYSEHFKAEERKRLDDQPVTDIVAEINLIRVHLSRLEQEINYDEKKKTDSNGNSYRDEHYLTQLNTLSNMVTSLATLVRTHYLTNGKSNNVTDAIMQALEELRIEMGI